jgi:hypothetical protein
VTKRTVVAVLWFATGWGFGNLFAWALGAPALLAPMLAIAAAGLVAWDPTGKVWGPQPDRKRIARRIADLERVSPTTGVPPTVLEPEAE